MLPILKFAEDKGEHTFQQAVDFLEDKFSLSDAERKEMLPSGGSRLISNRAGWAITYLKKAGLLESSKRAHFEITELGFNVLNKNPSEINSKFLEQFPKFVEFRNIRKDKGKKKQIPEISTSQTPLELMEDGYQNIKYDLSVELLDSVKHCTPTFFEKLVVELLLAMGYGGSRKDAGEAIGKSGDGGIDGIIKEDKLGLDVIYIQAKRWEASVGSNEIRNFVGSLVGQKANKGVFITTSSYTKNASEYVKTINHKVILIDGELLTELMIENNIGVSKVQSYDIKKIDSDYFLDE